MPEDVPVSTKNPPPPITPPAPLPEPDLTPKPKPSHLGLIIISIIALLTCVAAGAYWWGAQSSGSSNRPLPITLVTPTSLANLSPALSISRTGITWNTTPTQITALTLFKPTPTNGDNTFVPGDAKYYLVGTETDGTKIINAYIPVNGPGGEQFLRVLQTKYNQLTVISPLSEGDWLKTSLTQELNSGIKISSETIAELDPPETLTANGMEYERYYYQGTQFDQKNSPVQITDTSYGPLYRVNNELADSPAMVARQIILRLKDNTVVPYTLKTNLAADDKTPQINWTDSSYQSADFTQNFLSGGCGTGLLATVPVVKNAADLNNKVSVGKSSTNQEVYKITDPTNPVAQSVYNIYKAGQVMMDKAVISPEDFIKKPNHYLWQDSLGDWQVFINQEFIPASECAKPVIYLYPGKSISVQIKVGAQIRLSDPPYPDNGWQVLAQPNGQLTYQDKTYSSLFWDGLGNGPYPDYRDFGVVVTQPKLLPTLKSQLHDLGLNASESQDFLAFWQAKLPTTPYIRLTWLGTADMERLAPLTVSPEPDTRIRIFLEFEALNQPVVLKSQKLTSPSRQGFTLVEWGGLLKSSR